MLLLNVSDIHFKYPRCTTNMDPDKPFRTHLQNDVRDHRDKLGNVDAILVTGDIAAAGLKEEYESAYEWLQRLAEFSGCHEERIYVVPGNHDVNRGMCLSDPSIGNAQKTILSAKHDHRESELEKQFGHQTTGRTLLSPISAYNDFAAKFSCQLWAPDQMYWSHIIPIDKDTNLRLHGLNSTLFSGIDGKNDEKNKLYLSPLQTVLDPQDDELNAILSHHPPDWCSDCDEIETAVKERAIVHFFGHKHLQRIDIAPKYVRFSSGAVNPNRHELGWEPGYNYVALSIVEESGGKRFLNIEAHLRVFQPSPAQFVARRDPDKNEVFKHRISIPPVRKKRSCSSQAPAKELELATLVEEQNVEAIEAVMSEEKTRNLVLRFWQLASSQRKEIMLNLALIGDSELGLPEAERYGKAWKLAAEKDLIEKLSDEIEKREAKK